MCFHVHAQKPRPEYGQQESFSRSSYWWGEASDTLPNLVGVYEAFTKGFPELQLSEARNNMD